jgi:hypothetical protein
MACLTSGHYTNWLIIPKGKLEARVGIGLGQPIDSTQVAETNSRTIRISLINRGFVVQNPVQV